MTETLQIILFIMLVVVIIFFLVLGVQVFFLVREARQTLGKANKVIDNTNVITENVSGRISSLSDLVGGVTTGTIVAKMLKLIINTATKNDKKSDREEE
jgi:hypothetical protein